ncbi:MAG: hypothetical protein LBQ36_00125, partial [Synergistaceae bacterium]|nr:hypothetical protein [Synergistaceae bacterium]
MLDDVYPSIFCGHVKMPRRASRHRFNFMQLKSNSKPRKIGPQSLSPMVFCRVAAHGAALVNEPACAGDFFLSG